MVLVMSIEIALTALIVVVMVFAKNSPRRVKVPTSRLTQDQIRQQVARQRALSRVRNRRF